MSPKLICPHCGKLIERNQRVDKEKIMSLLRKGPKTFTELLKQSRLSRYTLSKRLQELCRAEKIVKEKGYRLGETQK